MGLTKEVRDFFTGRINRLLDGKLAKIYEQIDRKQVKEKALELVCSKSDVPMSLIAQFTKNQERQETLKQEERELRSLIYSKVQKAFPKNSMSTYRDNVVDEVSSFAVREYEDKILAEQYPQLVEEIAKIRLIKEDVESVVLLSTSETKLVQRLTQVLEKYGGDIPEITQYIPE